MAGRRLQLGLWYTQINPFMHIAVQFKIAASN